MKNSDCNFNGKETNCKKLDKAFTEFLSDGGGIFIFFVALLGIFFACMGFYWTVGFNLKWFFCLHLPIFLFCTWALWKAVRMYFKFLKDKDENEFKNDEKKL